MIKEKNLPLISEYEVVENLLFIKDNIHHIECELKRNRPSFFRIAKESYSLFYRSMVESLRSKDNSFVSIKFDNNKDEIIYDNKILIKSYVPGCKNVFRLNIKTNINNISSSPRSIKKKEKLPHYYTLLAMIQNDLFMMRNESSKNIFLADEYMKCFEFLHEKLRNEYEHFLPRAYTIPIVDLIYSSYLCCYFTKKLIYESGNVFSRIPKNLQTNLNMILAKYEKYLSYNELTFSKISQMKTSHKTSK